MAQKWTDKEILQTDFGVNNRLILASLLYERVYKYFFIPNINTIVRF